MKTVILAGGFGTRISEESQFKPKPMVEIGGMPILWHIMKIYSYYGFNEFIICAGYKQNIIKEWFSNYFINNNDVTFDFTLENRLIFHNNISEPWVVTVVNTGLETMTGGRIKRIKNYINNEQFLLTYGDGVSDINIKSVVEYHVKHGKIATLTAIQPESRYGMIDIDNNRIKSFREKSIVDSGWINGGFMVLDSTVIEYIDNDKTIFERGPLEKLALEGNLMCYKHTGFWQCMDTLRDKEKLDSLWASGKAPWKIW